ncbi:MAG: PEP-CTERM sorting domain-containing protein [Armatimonadetes bacterium]|nr:PEP-CTERM sorting domain-containing protein [Armatimonadota bacterium]
MKQLACILALAAIIIGCCVPSEANPRKPARPGSFVRYSIRSVEDLVDQVTNNPVVAKRYAEHFGTSPEKLARYFQNNLTVITLKSPVKVRTYFISKNGRIASKHRVLPAGRQVFATLSGEMLIETDCGNPLTKKLPPVETKVKGTTEAIPPLPAAEEVAFAPPVEAGPELIETFEDATVRTVQSAVEPLAEFGSSPSLLQVAQAVAPVLAGLHLVHNRKSSPSPAEVVIPEPGSLVSLSLGCSGIAFARLARRRRTR